MRGHIIKRYKDSYSIVLNLGIDPSTGKRKQQWVSVKGTKKEAEKRLSELLHQLDNGIIMKPSKTTVKEFLERWLKDYQPNLSPRGYERYQGIIIRHLIPKLGNIALTQLKPEHLQKHYTMIQSSGLSPRTVRYHHAVIHVALKTAVRWGLLTRNPADAVTVPRVHRNEMQTWSEYEVEQFLNAAKVSPSYALFYTALFTLRRSELLGLKWENIDLLLGQIYVNRLHQLKDGTYIFTEPKSVKNRDYSLATFSNFVTQRTLQKQALDRIMMDKPLHENLVFNPEVNLYALTQLLVRGIASWPCWAKSDTAS